MGYKQMQAKSIKPKHIEALVAQWQEKDLSIGTIKNRMAAIRWWANKTNKQNVVARSNEHIWPTPVCKSHSGMARIKLQSYIRPFSAGLGKPFARWP